MGFGTYARKVHDPSLPYGRRVKALAGCVHLYQPIGYNATFAYLRQVAGNLRRDETALLRAMDMLSSSRNLWLVELGDYARRRKEAKRLGQRSPRAAELDPSSPARWYGDQRDAAMFALGYLVRRMAKARRARGDRADAEVLRLAHHCVDNGGSLGHLERAHLDRLRRRFGRQRAASGRPGTEGHDSRWVLRLVTHAALPEPGSEPAAER